jgi:CRP/FNR family transcriptional regulator, cyclic AMP receptor protein
MSRASRTTETLAKVPLFRSLESGEINRLDTQCSWRSVSNGQWIIGYQEETDDVFFVVRGTVRVKIQSIAGREVLLREISTGEYFGELSSFDGQPRSSGIIAVTDVVIARMPKGVFRTAIQSHPDVCDQVLANLTGQIRMASNRINEFSNLDVRHRIYAELLRLSRPAPSKSNPKRRVISPPPFHAEIAARVSTRREAVSREIKALERSGLLIRRRGALEFPDPDAIGKLIDEASTE